MGTWNPEPSMQFHARFLPFSQQTPPQKQSSNSPVSDPNPELKIWTGTQIPLEQQGNWWVLLFLNPNGMKSKCEIGLEEPLVLPCIQGLDGTQKCKEAKGQGGSPASWWHGICHPSHSLLIFLLHGGSLTIRDHLWLRESMGWNATVSIFWLCEWAES